MKKTLIMLAIAVFAYARAEGQTKKATNGKEKCTLSADGKYKTCCKTVENPAHKVAAKTTPAKKVVRTTRVKNYQVCKDEGGYYNCCTYKNTQHTVATR